VNYNKENKKGEYQGKLHIDGKSETKSQTYTVQRDAGHVHAPLPEEAASD
jgi:hypothetical protein